MSLFDVMKQQFSLPLGGKEKLVIFVFIVYSFTPTYQYLSIFCDLLIYLATVTLQYPVGINNINNDNKYAYLLFAEFQILFLRPSMPWPWRILDLGPETFGTGYPQIDTCTYLVFTMAFNTY